MSGSGSLSALDKNIKVHLSIDKQWLMNIKNGMVLRKYICWPRLFINALNFMTVYSLNEPIPRSIIPLTMVKSISISLATFFPFWLS